MKKILIAGGSGLVGKALSRLLLSQGFEVAILSRRKVQDSEFKYFYWNPSKLEMDENAILWADSIVQLTGASIASQRWSEARKREIVDSRVQSSKLIFDTMKRQDSAIEAFISASAVGIYGAQTSVHIFEEDDAKGDDFLAQTCMNWENAVDNFNSIGIRTVKLRIGVVLSAQGGALEKMMMPFRFGLGSVLGSGKQFLPWIHLEDLCQIFLKAINDNQMRAAYNAVAPEHVNNSSFSKSLAKSMNRWFFMPNIPSWVLRMMLGEMAVILLEGSRISSDKLLSAGFEFKYPKLDMALKDLLN